MFSEKGKMDLLEYLATHGKDPNGELWDWLFISGNPKVTAELIAMYPKLPWDCRGLASNPSLSLAYMMPYYYQHRWLNNSVASGRPTTFAELEKYQLNLKHIWLSRYLPMNEVLARPAIFTGHRLSQNYNLTFECILAHLDREWWWDKLSQTLKLTISDVLAHPSLPWNWFRLSMNQHLSIEEILMHPKLPWDFRGLAMNRGVTEAQLLAHPEIKWDWSAQFRNRHLSLAFILRQAGYKLDVNALSKNKGLTLDQVLAHPEIKWNWSWLVRHLGASTYPRLVRAEMRNPVSYFSLLPADMWLHYLSLYLR